MTHPDIIAAEIFGGYPPRDDAEKIGVCTFCEENIFDGFDAVESVDGMFCNMDCCCEYYEIRKI